MPVHGAVEEGDEVVRGHVRYCGIGVDGPPLLVGLGHGGSERHDAQALMPISAQPVSSGSARCQLIPTMRIQMFSGRTELKRGETVAPLEGEMETRDR